MAMNTDWKVSKNKGQRVINGYEVLWSRRAKFAKWEFLQRYTVSVILLPLRRDACKCHCPNRPHVFRLQEGPAADFVSDLGRDDPCLSCFCLFMTSAIVCLCLCPVSASHIPLILWWFSFFILTPHLALCCPCYCRHYLLRQKNLLKIERPVFFSPFMAVLPSLFNLCLWAEYY